MRGYAPTAVPADGRYQAAALALDACALHDELGGDGDAVIIGHDWGAVATYIAANHEPDRWRRVVTMAVPPTGAVAGGFLKYDQLKKSWYMFFFQHALADIVVRDGRPGVHRPALGGLVARLRRRRGPRAREGRAAGSGATWLPRSATTGPTLGGVGVDPALDAVQAAGGAPTAQPTLYLHGRTDGCMGGGHGRGGGGRSSPPRGRGWRSSTGRATSSTSRSRPR